MRGGKAKIKFQHALLYYALRRLDLDTDPNAMKPRDQQIVLLNRETLGDEARSASDADLNTTATQDIVQ